MSLYQVPPPEESEPFSALQATRRRLTLWLAALSSVACMVSIPPASVPPAAPVVPVA